MELKELLEAPKLLGFERSTALEHYETLCDRAVGLEADDDSNAAMNYILSFATFVTRVVDTITNNERVLSAQLLGDELYGRLKDIVVQSNYDEEECRASITYFVQFGNPEIFNELCEVLNIPNKLDVCRKHLVTTKTRQFENLNKLVKKNHMRLLPYRCEFTHQQVLEQFQFCKEDGKLLKIFVPKDAEADLSRIHDSEVVALIPPTYDEADTVWYNKSIARWSKLMNIRLRECEHKDSIDTNMYKEIMLDELIPEVKSTPYGQGKTLGMLGALKALSGNKDFSLTNAGVVDTQLVKEDKISENKDIIHFTKEEWLKVLGNQIHSIRCIMANKPLTKENLESGKVRIVFVGFGNKPVICSEVEELLKRIGATYDTAVELTRNLDMDWYTLFRQNEWDWEYFEF